MDLDMRWQQRMDILIGCTDGTMFWWHPFTAEKVINQSQLVSKWFNATFLKICSDEETKYIHFGGPEGEYIFSKSIFGLTIPFKDFYVPFSKHISKLSDCSQTGFPNT